MNKIIIQSIAVFLGITFIVIFRIITKLGYTVELKEFPENPNCQYHSASRIGPEDITKIRENVIIGMSNDNIAMWESQDGLKSTPPGYLWVYYPDTDISQQLKILNQPTNFVFQPHGIYYEKKSQQLYVINHAYQGRGDRVEVFQLDETDISNLKVTWKFSLQMPEFLNGTSNDLIKISENELVITQWLYYPDELNNSSRNNFQGQFNKFKTVLFSAFDMKVTNVYSCQYNPKKGTQDLDCIIIEGTSGNVNNGITWNQKDKVLVADTSADEIIIYHLNLKAERNKRLVREKSIPTTRHPDNIEYDEYLNQYTVGGMGKIHQYLRYLKIQIKQHPKFDDKVEDFWQFVDIIKPQPNGSYSVENVLLKSDVYRGCSIGIQYKNKIYLGSFTDKSFAICDLQGINTIKPITPDIWGYLVSLIHKARKQLLG